MGRARELPVFAGFRVGLSGIEGEGIGRTDPASAIGSKLLSLELSARADRGAGEDSKD